MRRQFQITDSAAKGILYALLEKEKRPTIQVLLHVVDGGYASQTTAYSRIDRMIEAGLIEEHYERGSTARYLSLTEKGKKVVEYLKKIDEVMEG